MGLFTRITKELSGGSVYLIDTENVRTIWTLILSRLKKNDKVYVFHTDNSGSLNYEESNLAKKYGDQVEYIRCFTGKNGLDFQLVSFLGYLIHDNPSANYLIISNDTGFDSVAAFWQKRGSNVMRKSAKQVQGEKKVAEEPVAKAEKDKRSRTEKKIDRMVEELRIEGSQPAKQEPKKQEPKKQEPKKQEPKKQEPKKQEPKKQEPKKQEPKKQEPKKQEPPKQAAKQKRGPKRKCTLKKGELAKYLPQESPEMLAKLETIIKAGGGPEYLLEIHSEIMKLYRSEHGAEVYKMLKPHIKGFYAAEEK